MSVSDAWKKLSEETVWAGPYWEHRRLVFERPDGKQDVYEFPKYRDGVMVIVVNDRGQILVQSQYRPFIERVAYQFPAGGVDDGESLEEGARRELAEESQLHAHMWQAIGDFYPGHGDSNRRAFVYLASDLEEISARSGDEFELSHDWMTAGQIDRLISDGELKDGWAIVSWTLAKPHVLRLIDAQNQNR